jgi:hypothetical protein
VIRIAGSSSTSPAVPIVVCANPLEFGTTGCIPRERRRFPYRLSRRRGQATDLVVTGRCLRRVCCDNLGFAAMLARGNSLRSLRCFASPFVAQCVSFCRCRRRDSGTVLSLKANGEPRAEAIKGTPLFSGRRIAGATGRQLSLLRGAAAVEPHIRHLVIVFAQHTESKTSSFVGGDSVYACSIQIDRQEDANMWLRAHVVS